MGYSPTQEEIVEGLPAPSRDLLLVLAYGSTVTVQVNVTGVGAVEQESSTVRSPSPVVASVDPIGHVAFLSPCTAWSIVHIDLRVDGHSAFVSSAVPEADRLTTEEGCQRKLRCCRR